MFVILFECGGSVVVGGDLWCSEMIGFVGEIYFFGIFVVCFGRVGK